MKFKALLNKRNYIHLYNLIKPYPNNIELTGLDYSDFKSLNSIIQYFEVKKYKKIIVVASGPSANKLLKDTSCLYFCCNDSIKLVDDLDFIYMLQDPFYLMRYLKTFKGKANWKGTVFWFYYSDRSKKMYDVMVSYLMKKSREKREFLITNNENEPSARSVHREINEILKEVFKYEHYGVNSGFNTLVFATVLAYLAGKPLEIYGLDAGVGGERYFNKNSTLGLNIKKDNTKFKIAEFLDKLRECNLEVYNFSNFKGGVY
jgi:hypothetical protein